MKSVNFVLVNGKSVVKVAKPKRYRLSASRKGAFYHVVHQNFCDNSKNRRQHGCSMQRHVVFTVVLKVSRCKARFSNSIMSSVSEQIVRERSRYTAKPIEVKYW